MDAGMRRTLERRKATLSTALKRAEKLSEDKIVRMLPSRGWRCTMCARCCTAEHGDNTVQLSREEIEVLMRYTGLPFEEIAEPSQLSIGHIRLGWTLRRSRGRCIFLRDGRCTVYDARPLLCATYPFWLRLGEHGFELEVSECEGLGLGWEHDPSGIVQGLKHRLVCELSEEMAMLEHMLSYKGLLGECPVVVDSSGVWEL